MQLTLSLIYLVFRNMCLTRFILGEFHHLKYFSICYWFELWLGIWYLWLGLLFQLRLVLHLYSRICLLGSNLPPRLHKQANGVPMENLCEAFCCSCGFPWPNTRIFGFSQLPCTTHVQIHKVSNKGTREQSNCYFVL